MVNYNYNNIKPKPKQNNIFYEILIVFLWSHDILFRYFRALIIRIPMMYEMFEMLTAAFVILVVFLAFSKIRENLRISDVIFGIVVVSFYFMSWALNSNTARYFEYGMSDFLFSAFPLYFIGVTFNFNDEDSQRLQNILYIVSLLTIVFFTVYNFFINQMDEELLAAGDMDKAYKLLPHINLIFANMVKKKSIVNISMFVFGVFLLFSLGTRGAVLCLLVYIALIIVFMYGIRHPWLTVLLFIVGFGVLTIESLFYGVVRMFYQFAVNFGMSTRFFDKLLTGEITNDSGRSVIHDKVIEGIKESPLLGKGLYSDRAIAGSYSHNIALEFLIDFGIIFGVIFLVIIASIIINALIRVVKNNRMDIMPLFFVGICSGMVKLMISGSYLSEVFFFFLLGVGVNILRNADKGYVELPLREKRR